MKNSVLYALIAILGLALLGFVWFLYSSEQEGEPQLVISSFEECVKAGNLIVVSTTPRQCLTPEGSVFLEKPIDGVDVEDDTDFNNMIEINTPQANATISSPLTVSGQARGNWYFEASFPVRIIDANGQILAHKPIQALGDWMTEEFVPFETSLGFNQATSEYGYVIFAKDNPSGLPEYEQEISVPIRFESYSSDYTKPLMVQVFFSNTKNLIEGQDECSTVFSVERFVSYTTGVGKAAIEELLEGVSEGERVNGFDSSINPGVKLNSLKIENGIAYADFDDTLDRGVGGSCRVTLIRKQITETLKQFPTVKDVVISVEGNVEEALQP